jgi:hypothetical protein
VTDTGIGIDPSHVEKIWDPFWQAEHPLIRRAGAGGAVHVDVAAEQAGQAPAARSPCGSPWRTERQCESAKVRKCESNCPRFSPGTNRV